MKQKSALRFLFGYIKPYWAALSVLILLFFVQSALTTIQPLVIAPVIDLVLGENSSILNSDQAVAASEINLNTIVPFVSDKLNLGSLDPWTIVLYLAGIYLIVSLVLAVLNLATFYLITYIRVRAFRDMQFALFDHMLSLSLDFYSKRRIGEIMSRFENDTRNSIETLALTLQSMITAPLMILFYGYLLLKTNFELSLLVVLTAAIQGGIARLLKSSVQNRVRDQFDVFAKANGYIQEIFTNVRVVKSFVAEKFEVARFKSMIQDMLPIHMKFAIYKHVQTPLNVAVNGISNVAILLLAASQLLNGDLTIPGFALFILLGREVLGPINQVSQVYVSVQTMGAASERVIEIFEEQPLVQGGVKEVKELQREIVFENVSFAYGERSVVSGLNFQIKKGEVVALVGPSGAGKSTVTDLLMRFYDPSAGSISIDGVDLREVNLDSYRRLFGVVAQENLLFNTSISSNIAYGRNIPKEQIEQAAQIANAASFIEEMPGQFETVVGDRGTRVSGGQRQRIAIARAVANRPSILILDEATSSLDTESERLVQEAIDRAISGTTAVVVAHRLSTVANADRIVVLDEGKLLDQGTHGELLERCELYRRLCELQFVAA